MTSMPKRVPRPAEGPMGFAGTDAPFERDGVSFAFPAACCSTP